MISARLRPVVAAWNRFWFEPTETSTLALVRIALGVVVIAWTLSLAGDLFPFFAPYGIQPSQLQTAGSWGLLALTDGDLALGGLYAALLLAAAALAVGFHTRLAALITFVSILSLERRSPFVLNAGDHLLRILALYVMLAPAGAALSLDRWRARRPFWEFPERAPWALRLMQLQLSFVYLGAVWAKVRGTTWNDGTAISYALRLTDLERFPVPGFVSRVPEISALITYSTLGIELALGLLVWNRRLRPWVLLLGVLLHLGIDWSLRVGFFSLAVFVMYVAFIPPERASAGILKARDRLVEAARRFASRAPEAR
jgi:hypothetical protein